MKYFALILSLTVPCSAAAQQTPRTIIERAVKAHGGADEIRKLRKAKVTYSASGLVPGFEHFGDSIVEVEEIYDMPKI